MAQSLEADAEVQALKAGAVKASMSVENVMDKTAAETAAALEAAVGTAVSASEAFSSSAGGATQAETSAEENAEVKEMTSAKNEEEAPKEEEEAESSRKEASSSAEDEEKPAASTASSKVTAHPHPKLLHCSASGQWEHGKDHREEGKLVAKANGQRILCVGLHHVPPLGTPPPANPLAADCEQPENRGGRRGGISGVPPLPGCQ